MTTDCWVCKSPDARIVAYKENPDRPLFSLCRKHLEEIGEAMVVVD